MPTANRDEPSEPKIGPVIGRGRVADVHAWGEGALKLYHGAGAKTVVCAEAAILAVVEEHRLPAPRVHGITCREGRWGLIMDRLDGPTLGALVLSDPTRLDDALAELVRLQLLVHRTVETRLRPLKARLGENIARAPRLTGALRAALLARLHALSGGDRLCHGDFHPMNVIATPLGSMIVDWPDATTGPPAADVCRSYILIRSAAPELADAYLTRYLAAADLADDDVRAWLPVVAAARLAEMIGEEEEALLALAATV